jgi:hypothetical protein
MDKTQGATIISSSGLSSKCLQITLSRCSTHRQIHDQSFQSPAYQKLKDVPHIMDKTQATTVLQAMNAFAFFL